MSSEHINIQLQDGPIKEVGVNGCQIDDVIKWTIDKLKGFNEKVPSPYTSRAIGHLGKAISELEARTLDRSKRGVEGTYEG